eukprot:8514315-Pyramimonas_sp.AAC.1
MKGPRDTQTNTHKSQESPYVPIFSRCSSAPPLPISSHIFLGVDGSLCLCVSFPPDFPISPWESTIHCVCVFLPLGIQARCAVSQEMVFQRGRSAWLVRRMNRIKATPATGPREGGRNADLAQASRSL